MLTMSRTTYNQAHACGLFLSGTGRDLCLNPVKSIMLSLNTGAAILATESTPPLKVCNIASAYQECIHKQ